MKAVYDCMRDQLCFVKDTSNSELRRNSYYMTHHNEIREHQIVLPLLEQSKAFGTVTSHGHLMPMHFQPTLHPFLNRNTVLDNEDSMLGPSELQVPGGDHAE